MSTSKESLVAELAETWDSIDGLLAGLSDEQWQLPTSCPGWLVADQVAHLIGTESTLAGRQSPESPPAPGPHVRNDIGRFNEAWIDHYRNSPPTEVLAAWREIAAVRKAQLEAMTEADFDADSWTPVGPSTYRRFMQIRVFDCWVHEQDIRAAVGLPGHQTGPAADRAFDEMTMALGYLVGKRAGAPDGTRLTIELTAPLSRTIHVAVDGRASVVPELGGPPTAVLRMPSPAFSDLTCGRADVDTVLASGQVVMEGDRELAERIARHLAFTI